MRKVTKLQRISGGAIPSIIVYPALGCGTNMAYTYYKNPDSTQNDMGRACIKGAIHGLNPAVNLLGPIGHAPTRYVVGMGYGFFATEVADYVMKPNFETSSNHTCTVLLGND